MLTKSTSSDKTHFFRHRQCPRSYRSTADRAGMVVARPFRRSHSMSSRPMWRIMSTGLIR